jgi:hypothetical protein
MISSFRRVNHFSTTRHNTHVSNTWSRSEEYKISRLVILIWNTSTFLIIILCRCCTRYLFSSSSEYRILWQARTVKSSLSFTTCITSTPDIRYPNLRSGGWYYCITTCFCIFYKIKVLDIFKNLLENVDRVIITNNLPRTATVIINSSINNFMFIE